MQFRVSALGALAALVLAACGSSSEPEDTDRDAGSVVPEGTAGRRTDFRRHSVPLDEFISGGRRRMGSRRSTTRCWLGLTRRIRSSSPRSRWPPRARRRGSRLSDPDPRLARDRQRRDRRRSGRGHYCPLCNSTVAFSRDVDGRVLDFGTTGRLRNSDLVMYDRQTESWWQQLTAEAVVGELAGSKLEVLPPRFSPGSNSRARIPMPRSCRGIPGSTATTAPTPTPGTTSPTASRSYSRIRPTTVCRRRSG